MSETTGPAPPTAPTADTSSSDYTPAPDTRPELSVSDAARMLRNARRAQAAPPQGDLPGIGHNSGEAPAAQPTQPAQTAQPGGMSALERALGLDSADAADAGTPQPPQTPAQTPAEIELEGRRYTQAELAAAVRQSQDYTQKTQQLSAQARQLQAQQQALAAALPLIQPEIEALQRRLAEAPRPDPQLRQTDPAAYWDQLATWQDAQIEHQRVLAIQTHQAQAREAAVAQAVDQANHELAQKYPFWSDPQQRREIQQDIISWARTQGYTDQELHGLTSAKYLETLFKASLYDRYQARIKPQATQPAVGHAPRGAAPPPPPAARVREASEAFEQRPTVANAAALIGARRAPRGNGHTQW
jgi:fused signal recognition particle receptor